MMGIDLLEVYVVVGTPTLVYTAFFTQNKGNE
jgi:hypothetical protein